MKQGWKKKTASFLTAGFLTAGAVIGTAGLAAGVFTVSAVPALAKEADSSGLSGEPVRIESLGMEMKVPEEWVTITSEMDENNPVFEENHMDGAAMLKNYKEHGILIDCINMDEKVEFNAVLSGKDEKIIHLTQFSDEDVRKFADELASPETGGGVSFQNYEIYDHSDIRFIEGEAEVKSGGTVAGRGEQYYTIVNGSRLCFQMFSFDGELSAEKKAMFREMIDSLSFDSLQEAGPLSMSRKQNPVLKQLSMKYLLRNIVIVLGAVLAVYYVAEWIKKRRL